MRHAPIGPFVAVADVRSDGSVTVWTHSAQSQGLRARIAYMLGTTPEHVVVRWLDHSGQYGRTTFGGDGAESDAVILSQLTGKPVRVQWTLQEDMMWSSVSPAWVSDIQAGLDAIGHVIELQFKTGGKMRMECRTWERRRHRVDCVAISCARRGSGSKILLWKE